MISGFFRFHEKAPGLADTADPAATVFQALLKGWIPEKGNRTGFPVPSKEAFSVIIDSSTPRPQ